MSGNLKLKKHKITGVIFHEESKLVVKSVDEKRVVIGRLENNAFIPLDEQTKELCKTFAPTYGFKLEEKEEDTSEEESSSEEEESPVEESPNKIPVDDVPTENLLRENLLREIPPQEILLQNSPQNTPQIKPVSVVIHNNSQFSLEENNTPSFFHEFETSFNDYIKERQSDIKELEDKKSKLMSQVDVLEKQIRAIRTMFM
jgi:hypothetical protein